MQSRRQIDSFGVFVLCVIAIGVLGISSSRGAAAMGTLGGLRDVKDFQNSIETLDLGRFAVDEHNKQQNGDITFRRVVAAQEQVVAGTMYHLTIEAEDGGIPSSTKPRCGSNPGRISSVWRTLSLWSNPLFPGLTLASSKVVDASSKVHLHLKTKRGSKVEEHKVEMHCNPDGKWILRSLLT
uniref:Cysteine proteinase inhibitor n=1 Tax=Picea sitchensis TaxID=3332 RepID=B8LQU8_PICSI|nr:unknown [Picea sitchensis]